ncbi:MAG: FHA domain-containing protein [Candidatus Cohnella colombiensis]|uniref:FHA domain-containing protein n=1 Tax=Candidatus Cohnella colombiensis TaxID=3121368 RepID=A0AA95EWP5_9BACL|nr:MAG: FHA domain-containing protein [Cohnella sp.]
MVYGIELSVATAMVTSDMGTLPLLAALTIGIVVAIGAVIAFLNMTVRSRDISDSAINLGDLSLQEEDKVISAEWTEDDDGTDDSFEGDELTDYTIPMTKLLLQPEQAEFAQEHEPRLFGVEGEHAGASFRLLDRKLSLGRDSIHCGIVFPYEAGEVSRRHCTIRYISETGKFLLEDHGSSNGTYLKNGERLQPGVSYELHDGDQFSLSGNRQWFMVLAGQ